MNTIWKFVLTEDCTIALPRGAEMLTVAAQRGEICLWVKVDPDREREERRFMTFGTGWPIPKMRMVYLGTSQIDGGALIFHTFEILKEVPRVDECVNAEGASK